MKRTRLTENLLVGLLVPFTIHAQQVLVNEENLPVSKLSKNHAYVAPSIKLTRLNQTDAILSGAKGAWIVNPKFALGGAVYILSNNVEFPAYSQNLEFSYAGVTFDYIYNPLEKVALNAGILLGGGFYDFNGNLTGGDGIAVGEPEVSLAYMLSKNFRTALTVSYRGVLGVDLPGVTNSQLSGFSYGLALKLGNF